MMSIRSMVKTRLLGVIELLPFGRDIYLSLVRNRLSISYRGVYTEFEDAKRAVPSTKSSEYDIVNKSKADRIEHEKQRLDSWFHDIDYPVLFWLTKLLEEKSIVLELGGSVGHSFYSFEKYSPYPDGIKWIISELPEAMILGSGIAEESKEKRLIFIESNALSSVKIANVFFTAGTLQYMDKNLIELLQSMPFKPRNVIVHNLPCHTHKSFWTLQNLGLCEVPYHIYSAKDVINAMQNLGYELVDKWRNDRKVEIPFKGDLSIEGYLGFYFKL